MSDHWPRLSVSLGLAVVLPAYFAWPGWFDRKNDVGLLISMLFGCVAYTAPAHKVLAILYAHLVDTRELKIDRDYE